MPTFTARVRTIHMETWTVEADDEEDARRKMENLHADVDASDACGELVDFEVRSMRLVEPV